MKVENAPIAIITGAEGGMGRAIARSMGSDHRLYLTDFNETSLETFSNTL